MRRPPPQPDHVVVLDLFRTRRHRLLTFEVIGDHLYGSKKRPASWRSHLTRVIARLRQDLQQDECLIRDGEHGYSLTTPSDREPATHHVRFVPGARPRAGR